MIVKLRSMLFMAADDPLKPQRTKMLKWMLVGLNIANVLTALFTIPFLGQLHISVPSFLGAQCTYLAALFLVDRGHITSVGVGLSLALSALFCFVPMYVPGKPLYLQLLLVPLLIAGFVLRPAFVWGLCFLQLIGIAFIAMNTSTADQVPGFYYGFTGTILVLFSATSWLNYWHQQKNTKQLIELRVAIQDAHEDEQRARKQAEQAQQRAEQANNAKSQYLASMSHELRTPLTAILGYSEIVAEELADMEGGDPTLLEDMARINTAGRHLMDLISDVLDMSKIEAGRMSVFVEPFNAAALVREVGEMVRPLASQRNNTVEVVVKGGSSIMSSDRTKVRQILFNLMSNAAKFTESGVITLSLDGRTDDHTMIFEVLDTGIGMSQEALSKVFTEFVQADISTTRDFGGTGLGLALCEQFAKMLGGKIDVASDEGEGACFTVRLPRMSEQRENVAIS